MRTTKSIRPLSLFAQSDLAIYRKYQPSSGHPRPTSKTPFKWRFAGGVMMATFRWYWEMIWFVIWRNQQNGGCVQHVWKSAGTCIREQRLITSPSLIMVDCGEESDKTRGVRRFIGHVPFCSFCHAASQFAFGQEYNKHRRRCCLINCIRRNWGSLMKSTESACSRLPCSK